MKTIIDAQNFNSKNKEEELKPVNTLKPDWKV
jgi:hypothetical protein